VLIVEDDDALGRSTARMLEAEGLSCEVVSDGTSASERLLHEPFDVVLSDVHLPGTSGTDLLRTLRAYDLDVPVLLWTADPTVETAMEAVELGAAQYLAKPVDPMKLTACVNRSATLGRMARLKREALRLGGESSADAPGDRAGLSVRLDRAISGLWVAFQPVIDLQRNSVFGYEALLRSDEPSLPSPGDVLGAAERLGRVYDVGRRVRAEAIGLFDQLDAGEICLFVNLHASELLDTELYEGGGAFSAHASRIVLEVTERTTLERVHDLKVRTSVLRFSGFRLAVDDLGAGFAGLTSFVTLEPEIVKLDMSLVRGIDRSKIRQELVRSVVELCGSLGMRCVAEGIETADELLCVRMLGVDLGQGFYIGRPERSPRRLEDLRL
jgi:EAL domain-containing protein (putative c-di-GMP-specific phosphodiesterase class I)